MAATLFAYCTGVVPSDGWSCPLISKTGKQNRMTAVTEKPRVMGRFVNNIISLYEVKRQREMRAGDSLDPSGGSLGWLHE